MNQSVMYIQRLLFTILFAFLLGGSSWGQIGVSDRINKETDRGPSLEAIEAAAVRESKIGNNYGAMQYYKLILSSEPLYAKALFGYGDAAVKFAALDSAEVAYQKLVDNNLSGSDGLALLKLAGVKYKMGKYEEAQKLYMRYLFVDKPVAATPDMIQTAELNLENCNWAIESIKKPVIEPELFIMLDSSKINTKYYSEHSPYVLDDKLYFSSSRFPLTKDKVFPKRDIHKIIVGSGENFADTTEVPAFNEPDRHTTHSTFNTKGDVMYYSVCDFIGNTHDIRCEIYRRKKAANGEWGEAERLPEPVNVPNATNSQPSVGTVPGEKYEMLYFVSDRPGGKGQKDIWCSKIMADSFSAPMNLVTLNTAGDDVTPFLHGQTQTFYFSSDSLQTLGGFDVFRAKWDGKDWGEPVNMGTPINSGANDVYFMMMPDGRTAYMATNRRGSYNSSEEGCCYDLFQADFFRPQMKAITYLKKNGLPTDQILPYTYLTLIELDNPNAKPQRIAVDASGKQHFDLLPGKRYQIIAEKDRFSPDTILFSTPPRPWRAEMVKKLYLEPTTPNLVVTVYDKDSNEPILGATAKLFDLGQKLPNGNFVVGKNEPQIDSHTDNNRYDYPLDIDHKYQAVGSKAGYTVDSSAIVSTIGIKGAQTLEAKLYLRRGITLNAFTINHLTHDTLYNVTYRLLELPSEQQKNTYISPIGKNYQSTITFEKRYRIIASKEGFSSDSLDFSTVNLPKINFQTVTKELRLRPLRLTSYLPIPLYFDNDEPDKRTLARTTPREYRATYVDYIRRKEEFIEKYTEGMPALEKEIAAAEIDTFFERDVRGGWNRLMEFSEVLYEMLTKGDSIVITLKGYASPRAGSAYNKNLTDRRVSSVYNHFDIFDGGIYKKYVDSKQLVINREANGEAKAPPGISDNIKDERKSIYDVRASRERRLEIIGVNVNKVNKL